jgi:hypothetical protein
MIGDLSVLYPHHIHTFELDLAMGWSNSKKRTLVSAMIGFVGRHAIAIS